MQKGQIRVHTENIFPIIKKFLYSDHDIFLRELISNAVDATQKLKTLSSIGDAKGELGDLRIDVVLDAKEKTLSIIDRGIGMTQEEVDKYINQVAFSSAEDFLQKYKDANIIGHFGLGFYSAFMVSDRVEIYTKSYRPARPSGGDEPAVYWSCDGSPEFELYQIEKEERGTRIVLHINEDSKEFLESARIKNILEKFCRFLPVPIYFEDKQINNTAPPWTKKPSELTPQDYQNFYKELYPFGEMPLFWIHLNVDYPFNLTGILYFPRIKQSYEIQKDKIQLYSNQVFVTDEVKDIVPEFLMLLHGVIDSPDIPLNVSRSYLQGDPNVKKINAHITKKVADKLEEIFNKERNEFEEKWESLGLFVKYGMMTDDKFLERANRFFIMEATSSQPPSVPARAGFSKGAGQEAAAHQRFYTIDEYRTETEALQKNKDGKLVVLYTTDPVQQDSYIKACTAKGYKVVKMETLVDAAFINTMEMKWENITFKRVDADIAENLIDAQEKNETVLSKEEEEKLKEWFALQVPEMHVTVDIKGLSPDAPPVVATRPEFMRRMKDMANVGGGMTAFYAQMPDEVTLTVNGNHPIYQQLFKEENKDKLNKEVHNLADLALLSQGLLKGEELTNFINRSVELMQGKTKSNIILEV
jgi:molecular chaperone HtpG